MKRFFLYMMMVFFTFGCATTEEPAAVLKEIAPLPASERKLMAVMPYETKESLTRFNGLENSLEDLTVNSFFETKRFLLVERSRLASIMNEMKLSLSGITASGNAVSLGRQLGAQYIFIGTVSSVSPLEEKKSLGIAWIHTKGFEVLLQGRIIEIERGIVIASSTAKGIEKQTLKVAAGASTGYISPEETLVKRAFEKAITQLTNDLASQL